MQKPSSDVGETLQERLWRQAEEALAYARNALIVKMHFLENVLCRLQFVPSDDPEISEQYFMFEELETIAMNGEALFYNSRYVLERFLESDGLLIHDYLHMIIHCIFRHNFVRNMRKDTRISLWDLACDIAAENVIDELCRDEIDNRSGSFGIVSYDENTAARRSELQVLREKLKIMTAEKIYKHYEHLNDDEIEVKRSIFQADEHDLWYIRASAGDGIGGSGGDDANASDGMEQTHRSTSRYMPSSFEELQQMWEDVSRQVQLDLETFNKNCGRETGSLQRNLEDVNRERYDYTEFLQKFAVRHEAMKINDDEFDYIPYVFGLTNYDNMPFVEPLEYKEVKRIRDFVIAIDTSGSTYFSHAHYFVQKTYNILKSTESFASRVNVHIVQCDTQIQTIDKINSLDELETYIKTMKIQGGGGTVFQPVFDYVEEQVKNKEFTNLKGIIFFTDGYAVFPKREPDFLTAFVLLDEGMGGAFKPPELPPWSITLILEEEQLM